MKTNQTYTAKFRAEAVNLVLEQDLSLAAAGERLGFPGVRVANAGGARIGAPRRSCAGARSGDPRFETQDQSEGALMAVLVVAAHDNDHLQATLHVATAARQCGADVYLLAAGLLADSVVAEGRGGMKESKEIVAISKVLYAPIISVARCRLQGGRSNLFSSSGSLLEA